MTTVSDILTTVRDSLADEDKSRWTDARLLRLLNEAYTAIVTKAQLLRKSVVVAIEVDKNEYTLPPDVYLISRVINADGKKLDRVSHAEMDMYGEAAGRVTDKGYIGEQVVSQDNALAWEYDTGSAVQKIVCDLLNPRMFKTYPIINAVTLGTTFTTDTFGVVSWVEDDTLDTLYGTVVDISALAAEEKSFDSIYGVVVDMLEVSDFLKIYYRAKPELLVNLTDELITDIKWDKALKHYIIGMCLHDDQDTQNRQISADQLAMWQGELKEAEQISSKNNHSHSKSRTTYNPEI